MNRLSLLIALVVAPALAFGSVPAQAQEPGSPNLVYTSESVAVAAQHVYSLDVPCPTGTVVLGGGWQTPNFIAAAHSSDPSTAQTKNAWHLWGTNVEPFDQQTVTGVASCASAEAFPAGSLQYPAPVTVTLHPWPAASHISVIGATCPSGYVPIAGGFGSQEGQLPNTETGASFPTWAPLKNETGNTWLVGAENFENYFEGHFESWEMSSVATCVSANLAFGVFAMNAAVEAQEIEEPAVTTATCASGNVIAGGVAADNSDGTEALYSGALEAMYFNSARTGFSVLYGSGHPDHHLLRALAVCADIVPATASLGQLEFDAACQAAMPGDGGAHAVPGATATKWRCASSDGSTVPIPGNQGAWACAALGNAASTAIYLRPADPSSWVCFGLPAGAQAANHVGGRATTSKSGARVHVRGRAPARRPVGNLGKARVTIPATLLEATGAGDLLKGKGRGQRVHPVVLKARGRRDGEFVYAGGSKPRLTLHLRLSKNKKAYRFDLLALGGRLGKPRLCDSGSRATTHLTTHIQIEAGARYATDILARSFWRCGGKELKTARPALRLP